jgi:hypothetical protein
MWRANHGAQEAGVGRRRHAERVAADARAAVEQADGAPIKAHVDQLHRRAGTLRTRAEPVAGLDTLDHNQIRQLDQALDAVDTYAGWLKGRATSTSRLAHAVDTRTTVAKTAPSFARHPGEVEQAQWYALLDLAPPRHELERERLMSELELGR